MRNRSDQGLTLVRPIGYSGPMETEGTFIPAHIIVNAVGMYETAKSRNTDEAEGMLTILKEMLGHDAYQDYLAQWQKQLSATVDFALGINRVSADDDRFCSHCKEPVEYFALPHGAGRPGEWVTKYGSDPQCDASPSDNHNGSIKGN